MSIDMWAWTCISTYGHGHGHEKVREPEPKNILWIINYGPNFTDSRSVGKLQTEPVNEEIHQNYRFKTLIIGLSEIG